MAITKCKLDNLERYVLLAANLAFNVVIANCPRHEIPDLTDKEE